MGDPRAGEKLKVFISYSRKDSAEFADELLAGLEYGGFAPFLDRHDIAAGEDWEARLGGLIAQSDTVVFVVSPEAVKSEQCTWEVDRTIELSKRLLPVIFKSVPDHDIPEKLRRCNSSLRQRSGICEAIIATRGVVAGRPRLDTRAHATWGNRDTLGQTRTPGIAAFARGRPRRREGMDGRRAGPLF